MSEYTKILYQFETTEEDGADNVAHDILARYEVHELPTAVSNLVVVGFTKDGRKIINPWSVRPVIRRLIDDLEKIKPKWNELTFENTPRIGKTVLWQTLSGSHLVGYLHDDGRVYRSGGSSWERLSEFAAWMEIEKYEQ